MTPDEEASCAAAALTIGDLPTAAHHIAGLLADDPLRDEWLVLCERLFEAAADPVALTVPAERPWYGTIALHARALARDDRHTEAVHRILEVVTVKPEVPYLAWVDEWLAGPAAAVDPSQLVAPIVRYVGRFSEADLRDPARAAWFAAILPLFERLEPWSEPSIAVFHAIALRRLGRPAEALAVAQRSAARYGGALADATIGSIQRDLGDLPAAIASYERAANASDDPSVHLDLGDLLCEADRFAEALACYEQVLAIEPAHPSAGPSALFCRWRSGGDTDALRSLVTYTADHPENRRAGYLVGLAIAPGA